MDIKYTVSKFSLFELYNTDSGLIVLVCTIAIDWLFSFDLYARQIIDVTCESELYTIVKTLS